MVEQALSLDSIFASLADATRRDILQRVAKAEMSVGEIARAYDLSLAAISKHLMILERANLVVKHRQGKQQFVSVSPAAFRDASECLQKYQAIWNERFDALDDVLKKEV